VRAGRALYRLSPCAHRCREIDPPTARSGGDGPGPGDPGYRPVRVSYGGGQLEPSSDERTLAVLAHLLGTFVALLVIYLSRDRRDYAKAQAAETLNLTITVTISYVVSALLTTGLIGFVLLPIVKVWSVVMAIIAAVKTSHGEPWRYPLTLDLVGG